VEGGAVRPRVALVYPIPFGGAGIFGGGERYAVELGKALARRIPTRLVTFGEGRRDGTDGPLAIRTLRPLTYLRGERQNPLSLSFLGSLARADVIHCLSWNTLVTDLAILFARATGKRVFVTDVGGGSSLSLQRRLALGRRVDGFLLIAEQGGKAFAEFRSRWRIVYAGIDTQRFQPACGPRAQGVLFVGRLLPHKGVDILIEALDGETPLTVVGRPYHAEYFRLLQQLARGKRVTFATDASDEEVVRHYRSHAVSVLPSVCRTVYGDFTELPELLGFAALEAMACGTPVVCSRVGGMEEVVVDGETGYLVPPGEPAPLGERIRRVLGDPPLAARLGQAARARIEERFTWDRVAERCLAAYTG
jgi:glycosyltransferase involved in cell wall biosynthesis